MEGNDTLQEDGGKAPPMDFGDKNLSNRIVDWIRKALDIDIYGIMDMYKDDDDIKGEYEVHVNGGKCKMTIYIEEMTKRIIIRLSTNGIELASGDMFYMDLYRITRDYGRIELCRNHNGRFIDMEDD